jgi:class 3 adenylate cyclase/predicted ATPase
MTFDEILDQVITLLKRQGRVSYSALKRRFDLDDDYLNDLKDELLYVHPVQDDEGRGLVWVGNVEGTIDTPAPPPQSIPAPLIQDPPSVQHESPLGTTRIPEAERRQLTVMFIDIVESTQLASQLDPEEYRDVVRAYQTACTEIVQRYDGHVAQLLGDGLLIYFGYPHAHEDDAQRAVRAGLGILAALEDLNISLKRDKGIQLAVRLGIDTGLVVIGDMGGAGRQEQLALGETPNIAARIQGLAQPNTLAVSEATYRLVQGYFNCEALGEQTLRGVAEPLHVYRVLQESGARGRLDVAVTRGLTPLVGRESEVALLLERWEQVKAGQGQVILLSGDAGIGKSRLVQMLKEHIAYEPHTRWECRSAEYYQNTALFPLADLFQRLLRFEAHETPDAKSEKLEPALSQYRLPLEESVQLFAPLLSLPVPEHAYPPLNLSPQRQRQKTLETIVAILLELAEQQPVLFILEDLHWTDPTTLELLGLLLDQIPTASVLVLLTCRPHSQPAWHHRSYITEMTLNRLSQPQIERMTERITDEKRLPPEVRQLIVQRTDGVPLFVEEITKAILESGQLKAVNDHYELTESLSTFAIPVTLQDSLMARLDRLMTGKVIAQLGATIGRQFSYELLQKISTLDGLTLQRELGRLVEAELVYQRGLPPQATYIFKHALIQDAAYESLLKSTRRGYHRRIAEVLMEQFPETAETQPELLAHHYTEAGLTEKAVHYWHQAAQRAVERSAHAEAISHFTTGLALLQTLPETLERLHQELNILVTLGSALMATKGYGGREVEHVFHRARELCHQVGDTPQVFRVLQGLWLFYVGRAEYQVARELGEQLFALAQRQQDAASLLSAHLTLGLTLCALGAFVPARTHLEQGIALYDPQHPRSLGRSGLQDGGVVCLCFGAQTLWYLGFPDQARLQSHQGLTLAHHVAHPFSLLFALCFAALVHQLRHEEQAVQAQAEAAITLSCERDFALYVAFGTILRGWALAHQGQAQDGIAQLHQGLTAYRATGTEIGRPYYLALLAEAHGIMGQPAAGLTALTEALTLVDSSGERFYEPELHRLKGALLLQSPSDNATEAESCFQHAVSIAQSQQAKSWELRAATSLSRLWQQQGKRQEAHDLLAPVYGWFTEGFDTADLQEAKALLEALG